MRQSRFKHVTISHNNPPLGINILANYGMQVIDCGVALHNMHAPFELASKADIYEAKKGYAAFLTYEG